jgi:hypothetical protein
MSRRCVGASGDDDSPCIQACDSALVGPWALSRGACGKVLIVFFT